MRKLLLSVVALFAMSAQNAFAINLTFQFDVNSSGPSIYACNAGIKHAPPKLIDRICYDRISGGSCSPGCAGGDLTQCTANTTPTSCVCTGENYEVGNQGTYRLDFLQASTGAWTDNQEGMNTNDLSTFRIEAGTSSFNQIHTDNNNSATFPVLASYGRQLRDMSINLGSEVYGAEYFVDICYRGPQIDYSYNGKVPSTLNFALKAKTTVIDVRNANSATQMNYRELSGLQVKATAKCIMQDEFNYCLADILPGETSGCNGAVNKVTEHNFNADSAGSIDNGWYDLSKITLNEVQVLTVGKMSTGSNSTLNVTPRYCQIRYSFRESNATMRKWKLQKARICTYTEISEPKK